MEKIVPRMWRLLRHFWPWIRPQKPLIAGSFVALIAAVVVRLAEPWPLKFVLDRVILGNGASGHGTDRWTEKFLQMESLTMLIVCAAAVVLVSCLRAVLDYYQKIGFAKIGNRVLRELRVHLYRHLQTLSAAYHTRARQGDLTVRVTRDVSMMRDVTSTAVLPLLASVFVLIGMLIVVLILQWKLALLALVTVPLFALVTTRLSRGIHRVARKQRKQEGAMAATASESIGAIRVVQSLGLENEFTDGFSGQNAQSQKQDLKGAKLSAKLERSVDVLTALATALVLGYGGWLSLRGEMTPGDLVVFLTYLKRAFKPAKDFAKYTGRLAKASAAGERVLAVLETQPEIQDRPGATPAPSLEGHIEFAGVGFAYEPGARVLQGVDLEISAGERVAVVGSSGDGKTTLVSLLSRLYDPQSGSVRIDGHDIREFTVASLRSQISVVLQDPILFAATVGENIAFGRPDATLRQIERAARIANADGFIRHLPEGYDTQVAERGASLSIGQKQRICIARAILRDAPILVLDEPTSGLDGESERAVAEALSRLPARTTLLVTHDLQLATQMDRVVLLDGGAIREQGTPDDLLKGNSHFAQLHRMQTTWRGRRNVQ